MAAKQKTKFAILGLLSWKPMSGYDIKKLVDSALSHFWHENYGQIYPTLELLVDEKLASKRDLPSTGKRKRFQYHIPRRGRRAFRDWLEEPIETPVVRNQLQLKFFLSCDFDSDFQAKLIGDYRAQQDAVLQEYRASEAVLRKALDEQAYPGELDELLSMTAKTDASRARQCRVFYLTLRHGIRVIEARLAWCDEVLQCPIE